MAEKKGSIVGKFLNGEILTADVLKKYMPTISTIVVLALIYITYGYSINFIEQQNKSLEKEIKNLEAIQASTVAEFNNKMKYISLQQQIEERNLGLKEANTPAFTISANGKR